LLIAEKVDECNQEWEMLLANKCYFRKNIAYYYTDLNKIRLGQQRHVNFNNNKYKLLVKMDYFYAPPLQRDDECAALEDNYMNCLMQKALKDKVEAALGSR
jgi:hypothetical protein